MGKILSNHDHQGAGKGGLDEPARPQDRVAGDVKDEGAAKGAERRPAGKASPHRDERKGGNR